MNIKKSPKLALIIFTMGTCLWGGLALQSLAAQTTVPQGHGSPSPEQEPIVPELRLKELGLKELGLEAHDHLDPELKLPIPNALNPEVSREPRWLQFLYRKSTPPPQKVNIQTKKNYSLEGQNAKLLIQCPQAWIVPQAQLKLSLKHGTRSILESRWSIHDSKKNTWTLAFDTQSFKTGEHQLQAELSLEQASGSMLSTHRTHHQKLVLKILKRPQHKGAVVQIDRQNQQLIINGKKEFLYGYYGSEKLEQVLSDAKFGITWTGLHGDIDHLDSLQQQIQTLEKHNIKCFIKLTHDTYYGYHEPSQEQFKNALERHLSVIEACRHYPNVVGYMVSDEPCGSAQYKPLLKAKLEQGRALDPYKIHGVVNMSVAPKVVIDELSRHCDFICIDIYHTPGSIKQSARDCQFFSQHYNKPLITVPQMFGGSEWWQREPSPHEYRVKTWLEIIHGASSVAFFRRSDGFPRSPDSLAMIYQIASQIQLFDGFLISEEQPADIQVEVQAHAQLSLGTTLPTPPSKPSVQSSHAQVQHPTFAHDNPRYSHHQKLMGKLDAKIELHAKAYRLKDHHLVTVVNPQNIPLGFSITLDPDLEWGTHAIMPLQDQRSLAIVQNKIYDVIPALGVHHIIIPAQQDQSSASQSRGQNQLNILADNLQEDPSFERATQLIPTSMYSKGHPQQKMQLSSRDAVHGLHALYLDLRKHPQLNLSFNEHYVDGQYDIWANFSFWAKAKPLNPKEKAVITLKPRHCSPKSFTLSSQWERYEYRFRVQHANQKYGYSRFHVQASFESVNTEVWLDLVQTTIDNFQGPSKPSHYMAISKQHIQLYYDEKGRPIQAENVKAQPSHEPMPLKAEVNKESSEPLPNSKASPPEDDRF